MAFDQRRHHFALPLIKPKTKYFSIKKFEQLMQTISIISVHLQSMQGELRNGDEFIMMPIFFFF